MKTGNKGSRRSLEPKRRERDGEDNERDTGHIGLHTHTINNSRI